MTTFDDYIEATALYLSGFTTNQDQVTSLVAGIDAVATSLTLADTSQLGSQGLLEIDSELLWFSAVDTGTNVVTIAPFGRGYRGTTAAVHATGAKVTLSPVVPRAMIERAVNDSIRATWPNLFGVSTTEFVYTAAVDTYALPTGAQGVLAVTWDTVGSSEEWLPVRRWTADVNASTTDFASGRSISLFDPITPGRTVRVVYTHAPVALTSGDDFSDSGLRDSAQDLIQFAAAARLVPWFEVAQTPGVSAEANYAAGLGRQSSASALGRYLTQMYQLRQAEEQSALQSLYPIRSHYTR